MSGGAALGLDLRAREAIRETFSLDLYERTLHQAKELGYAFPLVSECAGGAPRQGRVLLLRHDIDVSPHNALQMARLESRVGVRSSYFVLVHSPYYNAAAPDVCDALCRIRDLGFEIGLHYEVDFYGRIGRNVVEGILDDARYLGRLLDIDVRSISQHKPASGPVVRELGRHLVDAYDERPMHGLRYVSDSGFRWRDESLTELVGVEDRLHALIHPTTWAYPDLGMEPTYRRCAFELASRLDAEFEAFIASTRSYLERRAELDRTRAAGYLRNVTPGAGAGEAGESGAGR